MVLPSGTDLALPTSMPHLSFADIIRERVPLTPSEAVALTLAVADVLDARRVFADDLPVPPDEGLLLSSTGEISVATVEGLTDEDETTCLAALLRRLLQLDDSATLDRRGRVPGALLVLLSRALQQIDLPSPGRDEFRRALARFVAVDERAAAALAAIFWRAAAARPAVTGKRAPQLLLPEVTETASADRRNRGASRAELRRSLRDLERELFERPARAALDSVLPSARRNPQPRAAIAGALVGATIAAVLTSSGLLDRAPRTAAPVVAASRTAAPAGLPVPAPRVPAATVAASRIPAASVAPAAAVRTVPVLTHTQIGQDVFSPSFGPQGHSIYFHAGRAAAPLMRAAVKPNGEIGGVTKLLDDGASNYHVAISPDGQRIAFDSDRDGVRGVYVADADGTNARRVSGEGYASVPSWSPDGGRLAFVRAEEKRAATWNIWIADLTAGTLDRITRHAVGQPWGASWFPDGHRLAYSREQQLVIADLSTGRSTVVASPRRGHLVRTPAVSPDGSRVVFQVHRDGAWMLDVARMRLRRILPDPSAEEFVWSPNGHTIAYHARSRDGWGVWAMRL
jgi:hypothetical protein